MSRLARTPPLRLAWLASLVACSSGVEGPWSPALRRELTGLDYAVYSAWLAAQRARPGTVLVDSRTTSASYPGLSLLRSFNIFREPVACLEQPGPTVTPPVTPPPPTVTPSVICASGSQVIPEGFQSPAREEASQDREIQRELSLPLEQRLTGATYQLVHEPVPAELLRQAGLVAAFSRVGFDRHLQVATFDLLLASVGGGLVSGGAAYRAWVERAGARWELVELELLAPVGAWNTDPGVVVELIRICDSTHTTNCVSAPKPIRILLPLPRPK